MPDLITISAAVGGAVGTITGLSGAALAWWRTSGERGDRELERFWDSFERQIRSAEARRDTASVKEVGHKYEEQLSHWRAQQDLEQVAPREIVKDEAPLSTGDIEQLKRLLEQSQALSPGLLTAEDHSLRGNAYYAAGEYENALAAYNRSLQLRPDDPDTLMNRGVTLDDLERYEDALADYNRSLELRPNDDADTLMNRGVTFFRLGRYTDSLADYDRALELRPEDPKTFPITIMNRGITLARLGRQEDALAAFNRALKLHPDHPATYYNRACLHSLWEKRDEAFEDLWRAIEGDQKYRDMARTNSFFDDLRRDPEYGPRFRELVGEQVPPSEDSSAPD